MLGEKSTQKKSLMTALLFSETGFSKHSSKCFFNTFKILHFLVTCVINVYLKHLCVYVFECCLRAQSVFNKYGVKWWWFALFGLLVHQWRSCGNHLRKQSEIHLMRQTESHLRQRWTLLKDKRETLITYVA